MMNELTTTWLLLGPKLKGMLRFSEGADGRHPIRLIFFAALGVVFFIGIYAGSAWFLRQTLQVELIGPLIPRRLMSMVLLILLSILLISALISSFSVMFLSDDLILLSSAPVPTGPLVFARFLEMLVYSSWMVVFFGMPVFLAYGRTYDAPASYYVALVWLLPGLLLAPTALAAMLAAVLTRLFSARRSRDLLIVLVVLGFVILYLMVRTLRPEQLLERDNFGSMMEFMEMFRGTEVSWLPTSWMTQALYPLLTGKDFAWLPALSVWAVGLALVAMMGWIASAVWAGGFARAQEGRVRGREGEQGQPGPVRRPLLGAWMDRSLSRRGLVGALLVKELRVFFRDTSQWLQLVLLGALAVVYLLNFVYLRMANFSWFTLYTVNHVLLGLVLSGIAVRFVFPAVSLEGRAWWIVRTAPVAIRQFLHAKLLIYAVPLSLLGAILSWVSCQVIDVPQAFAVLSLFLVLGMALSVSTLAVGFGAVFPKFKAENPAKIPTGIGGVAFMVTSMGFVLVFLLASFYPTFVLYELPKKLSNPIPRPGWFFGSLGISLVLTLAAVTLPMGWGRRRLEARQE